MIDLYIGGFSGSIRAARRTADAMAEYFDQDRHDVESLSFAQAMADLKRTADMAMGKEVYGHSASEMIRKSCQVESWTAFAPPLPVDIKLLVARAGLKAVSMTIDAIGDLDRSCSVARVNTDSAVELVTHPYSNMRHIGKISQHNSADTAPGSRVRIGFMTRDEFGYNPSVEQLVTLSLQGVHVAKIDGVHDELIIDPQGTLTKLDAALGR